LLLQFVSKNFSNVFEENFLSYNFTLKTICIVYFQDIIFTIQYFSNTCNKLRLDALISSFKPLLNEKDFKKYKNLNHQKKKLDVANGSLIIKKSIW